MTAVTAAGTGLFIGTDVAEVRQLAAALEATHVELCPELPEDPADAGLGRNAALESWRDRLVDGPPCDWVAVAMWSPGPTGGQTPVLAPSVFAEVDDAEWVRRAEAPLAAWVAALGAAVSRCADGGRIVAVSERPPPLDSSGWVAEEGLSDAVEALVRSLARSEGAREVRVNGVTTPMRIEGAGAIQPAPPLTSFPGTIEPGLADAVSMLVGPGVASITGTTVHADCGRSWR